MGTKIIVDTIDKNFLQQDFYIVWYYCINGDKCLYVKSDLSSFLFHESSLRGVKACLKRRKVKYEIQKVNLKLREILTLDK